MEFFNRIGRLPSNLMVLEWRLFLSKLRNRAQGTSHAKGRRPHSIAADANQR